MNRLLALLFAVLLAGPLAACDGNDGPVEEAGEEVDEALD